MSKVIKLVANWDSGEGRLNLPIEWQIESQLMKLDLLKDWIYLLDIEYNKEFKEWRKEVAALKKKKKK